MKIEPSGVIFVGICEIQTPVCQALLPSPISAVWVPPGRRQVNVCSACLEEQVSDGEWEIPGAHVRRRFDVVAYDKREKLFKLVECKRGSRPVNVGRAFGQLVAYYALVSARGYDFVDAFSRKVHLRYRRWAEATIGGQVRVAFYVALTDKACKRVDLLRAIRSVLPHIGIIRVKADGHCRNYVKEEDGRKDYELAKARPQVIKILQRK